MINKLDSVERRYDEIEKLLSDPDVLSDHMRVQSLAKEQASMKNLVLICRRYRHTQNELVDVSEILRNESDQEMVTFARQELSRLEKEKIQLEDDLKIALLPNDPNDEKNVIMEIRAGTGGDEAGLFVADLFKMYSRYIQLMRWRIDIIDTSQSGLGSIKEIVFQVKGDRAYSRLKHESGVHRVQRIPVTESSGRIHTSAATIAVLPEAEEVDVNITQDELQIDIFHASGHGGQNVQKVATAVRITHLPTGIVATCQDERSQFKNKEKAMSVLRTRFLSREVERQNQEITKARRSQVGTGDRSERVRTYNFPQNRVTDHRVGITSHKLEDVLEGDINQFIEAMSELEQANKLGAIDL